MKYVIVMILSFSLPSLAIAESPDNGKVLLEECVLAISLTDKQIKPTSDNVDKFGRGTLCLGFLKGILQTNATYQVLGEEVLFCVPKEGVSNIQAARIVVKYLKENPEKQHDLGITLAIQALSNAFPCPESAQ